MILDILGGGGSGKTTLKFALLKIGAIFTGFVPYTTRPKRPEEVGGVHYNFISEYAYRRNGSLILKREADGWLYGVDRKDLEPRDDGKVVVTTFDINGIRTLEKMGHNVKVVHLNIPEAERERRMLERGQDQKIVARRLAIDRERIRSLDFVSPVLEIRDGAVSENVERILRFTIG